MTTPPASPAQDRATLTAAATVAAPGLGCVIALALYLGGDPDPQTVAITGAVILAVIATGVACIQSQRRSRAHVTALREEVAALREEMSAARMDAAVSDIASLAWPSNVTSLRSRQPAK
ncbi:hypothetical protein [Stackebrandtia soli]|uniref:hypothetical protein n=1 Tax=Stackebrandtia soli TaxID=1892856 RepID=UPI0039E8FF57